MRALGGDAFVVREGVSGPFTTVSQLDEDVAATVASFPGVRGADPIISIGSLAGARRAIVVDPATAFGGP